MADPILHPELTSDQREQLFRRGIELFNRGEFFACHEAWEEIWRSTTPEPRNLFQGLIQVAVGLYHYHVRRRGDVARRVMAKGRRRLEKVVGVWPTGSPDSADSLGLNLEKFLVEVRAWENWLAAPSAEPPPPPQLVAK